MAEREFYPVYREFLFDGSNTAACMAWLNDFPQGATYGGGTAYRVSADPPAEGLPFGTVRIEAATETEFGPGSLFDWPPGWSCTARGVDSFDLPGLFETTKFREVGT